MPGDRTVPKREHLTYDSSPVLQVKARPGEAPNPIAGLVTPEAEEGGGAGEHEEGDAQELNLHGQL